MLGYIWLFFWNIFERHSARRDKISAQKNNNAYNTSIMTATVPTTLDVLRLSPADVRFRMLKESSVLFKINSLLLFSIDSWIVWFAYLQTQTHNVLFIAFCVVSLVVIVFEDDVKVVSHVTVVDNFFDVVSFSMVECFIVAYCVSLECCSSEVVCSFVVDCSVVVCFIFVCFLVEEADSDVIIFDIVVTGTHDLRLTGFCFLLKEDQTDVLLVLQLIRAHILASWKKKYPLHIVLPSHCAIHEHLFVAVILYWYVAIFFNSSE